MKYIEITESVFNENLSRAEVCNDNRDCFGFDESGRFYLYINFGDRVGLYVYGQTFRQILGDYDLAMSLVKFYSKENDLMSVSNVVHWLDNGSSEKELGFPLEDIYYCEYCD